MERIEFTDFFGLEVVSSPKNQIEAYIQDCLKTGKKIKITTMNAQIAYYYLKDKDAQKAISESLVIPDGIGLSWALKRLNEVMIHRYPGVELMYNVCKICSELNIPIYILGGVEGVAEKASQNLAAELGVQIAGFQHGFFNANSKSKDICQQIKTSGAKVLFVGLGAPRQEKWIYNHLEATGCTFAMGVGGSLDIYAKTEKRAPRWVQKANLEWLYRIGQHPVKKAKVIIQIMSFVKICLKGNKS